MLQAFVLETANAPGTATTINLAGAPSGRRTWFSAFGSSATIFYVLDDGLQQEWGVGTFTAGAPNTLARTTVLRNSAGTTARLNFTGSTRVYNAIPPEYAAYRTSAGISLDAGIINASAWASVSTGSSTAYAITPSPAISAYAAGQVFRWRAHVACGVNPTLAVNGLGVKTLKRIRNGVVGNLLPGDLAINQVVEVVYDDNAATFLVGQLGGFDGWQHVGQSTNASSVAQVDFTLPTAFDEFRLSILAALPATAAPPFIRLSFDDGATYAAGASDYDYNALQVAAGTATGQQSTGATSMLIGASSINNTTAIHGEITFRTGSGKMARFFTAMHTAGPVRNWWQGMGGCSVAGTPTNVRFGFVGFNVGSHTIKLEGRKVA